MPGAPVCVVDGVSSSAKLIIALEAIAVDGLAAVPHATLADMTGLSPARIRGLLARMIEGGVIERARAGHGGVRAIYRLLRPELIGRDVEKTWTVARDAMMRERYPVTLVLDLLGPLNALPGAPINAAMVRSHVEHLSLAHTETFWAVHRARSMMAARAAIRAKPSVTQKIARRWKAEREAKAAAPAVPAAPASPPRVFPSTDDVAMFIATRGVTRCPAAYADASTHRTSPGDRSAIAAHGLLMEAARVDTPFHRSSMRGARAAHRRAT